MNIPKQLASFGNKKLAYCVPNSGLIQSPLFLASPTAVTNVVRSYDLLEPHTRVRRAVAVGFMDAERGIAWTALMFPHGIVAVLEASKNDDWVSRECESGAQLQWAKKTFLRGPKDPSDGKPDARLRLPAVKSLGRFSTWREMIQTKPIVCFCAGAVKIECSINESTKVLRSNELGEQLMATMANQTRMLKRAQSMDPLIASDIVINRDFGREYLHIAVLLTGMRMWVLSGDSNSGG